MDFQTCYTTSPTILMEGSIGERLKREYNIRTDGPVGMADLIYTASSKSAIRNIYREYISIAERYGLPFIATTTTRRANGERVNLAGYNESIIADNVNFLKETRKTTGIDMFIGGLMGCRGDAYKATGILSRDESFRFHSWQADLFKKSGVDFLFAGIMPALEEAIGMAQAMDITGLPYIISFMIRKNGRLLDDTTIHEAIATIDSNTPVKPLCYMVNCVHPEILKSALACSFNVTSLVRERFRGIQANTSRLSPEELDNNQDLKTSDSVTWANEMIDLYNYYEPKIFGGCCGTDKTHIEEIAKRLASTGSASGPQLHSAHPAH